MAKTVLRNAYIAINGTAPFFTTIAAGFALMIIHRAFAFGAFKSHAFGRLIKGDDVILVRDGKKDWKEMARSLISEHDLAEDLRLDAKVEDVSQIKTARLERSGDISFIKREA